MAPDLTDGLPATTQAAFAALRQRFVAGLGARWAEIAGASDGALLHGALHRLAGAAGSYGYSGLSRCARAAEALAPAGQSPALRDALVAVEAEIRRVTSAGD